MLCEVPAIAPLIPSSAIMIVPLILLNLQKSEILLFSDQKVFYLFELVKS